MKLRRADAAWPDAGPKAQTGRAAEAVPQPDSQPTRPVLPTCFTHLDQSARFPRVDRRFLCGLFIATSDYPIRRLPSCSPSALV
jgi:hypothetical protein